MVGITSHICKVCGGTYNDGSHCMLCAKFYAQACKRQEIVPGLKRKNPFDKTTWEIAQCMNNDGVPLEEIEAKINQREAEIAKRLERSEHEYQEAQRKQEEFRKRNGYK